MTALGQESPYTNRLLGSRRSAQTDDREVPTSDVFDVADRDVSSDWGAGCAIITNRLRCPLRAFLKGKLVI